MRSAFEQGRNRLCECGEIIGDKPDLSSADDRVHIRRTEMGHIIISIMAAAPAKQGWGQGGKRVSASSDMRQILSETLSNNTGTFTDRTVEVKQTWEKAGLHILQCNPVGK
ncbi:hypothetical protein THS27_18905 [Thalassospira sp. MCCC 1A01428]|nr:hypothetical protein THS27_18905 [Thalassospira sp. MCCC 1A01428]